MPTVAIVGRPNVGKSSLFNRFLHKRLAIVDPTPGVTRDRNYSICDWNGRNFRLVDTGGMVPESVDMMERLITDQADFAINEADLVLFVVDTQVGTDTTDLTLSRKLNKAKKETILVANKADNQNLTNETFEFMKLGLGEPFAVSATVGLGIGELLDEVIRKLPPELEETEDETTIQVAVVGRPNVGKSSFINKLLGEERLIVSNIAGTTRDSVDSLLELDGQRYNLIDTAGLRRKYKIEENIEFYTSLRTTRAIDGSHVAIVLIDATAGITSQDQRILSQVLETRRAAVLAVNKWDLIEKDHKTADEFTVAIKEIIAMYSYLPIIYISALTGQRVAKVLELVKRVHHEHTRRIPTPELNDFLEKVLEIRRPPSKQGKFIRFKYLTQTETAPPTFVFFTSHAKLIDKSYIQFLINQLREHFGFEGVPIRLKFKLK